MMKVVGGNNYPAALPLILSSPPKLKEKNVTGNNENNNNLSFLNCFHSKAATAKIEAKGFIDNNIISTSSSYTATTTTPSLPSKSIPHLVLHFDINETLLVGDEAGGDTREDCLNKILAKSSFVQLPKNDNDDKSKNHYQNGNGLTLLQHTKTMIPTHWWDGSPIQSSLSSSLSSSSPPPPPLYTGWKWPSNTCPYYRTAYKKKAKTFTDSQQGGHGHIYKPLYDEINHRLTLSFPPKSDNNDDIPTTTTSDHHYHHHPVLSHIIPSFFHTLQTLQRQNIQYTLLLRTFGTDLPVILEAISDFAMGKHPHYPNFREPKLVVKKEDVFCGKWTYNNDNDDNNNDNNFIYKLYPYQKHKIEEEDDDDKKDKFIPIASGDEDILNLIESKSTCGIMDDYPHWNKNGNAPWAGKPLWIREKSVYTKNNHNHIKNNPYKHHIFFDDNIQNDPTDSIVAIRKACLATTSTTTNTTTFSSLSGEEILAEHGKHIVRVPTIEPIMNENWFLEQISIAINKG